MTLDEAVGYVRRMRGTRDRPSVGWGRLTPTELEVARLAVEGLDNLAIGGRLFMSRGTVKTHLSQKLGSRLSPRSRRWTVEMPAYDDEAVPYCVLEPLPIDLPSRPSNGNEARDPGIQPHHLA